MTRACLVFDFDGTVLDTEEPVYRSWAELWAEHGHDLDRSSWQRLIGTDDGFDPFAELERRHGRPLEPVLQARRRQRRDALQAAYAPRPGVLAWLDEADRRRVPVGIASSSPPEWVLGHLERLELRGRFAAVVGRGGAVAAKPAPDSYRLACELLEGDPGRSVAVEDSPHGIAAATAAGLFTVAVPHALTSDLDLSGADLVAASLAAVGLGDALAQSSRRRR